MTSSLATLFQRRDMLLDEWVAKQREIAALQAESTALLAARWELCIDEIAAEPMHRNVIERSMYAEYSAAGRISKGAMEFAFTDARLLHEEFPTVRESYERGLITPSHVREVLRESQPVREAIAAGVADAETLALYEAAALEVAETDTPPRTRVHARQIAAALAGLTIVEQHTRAHSERQITVRSVGDGMALLQAVLPEYLAVAIHDRLTKMALHMIRHPEDRDPVLPIYEPTQAEWAEQEAWERWADQVADDTEASMSGAIFSGSTFTSDPCTDALDDDFPEDEDPFPFGPPPEADISTDPLTNPDSPLVIHVEADVRTLDQLRSDLLTDLLLASDPSVAHGTGLANIHATVQVTLSANTLTGSNDRPAELDGHGPLHPHTARALAGDQTSWTRLFLNPDGFITQTDTYAPTEPMRRFLRARDQHCRFPGCRQPVHRCDIDHNHDHAFGGATAIDNLAHLCRAHHVLKHPDIPDSARWTVRQLPNQTLQWISPSGRAYPDPVARRVMFIPSDRTDITVAEASSRF